MTPAQPLPTAEACSQPLRLLAEQAFSRAAGAPLIGGNKVDLLIDGRANFDAWLAAIRAASKTILFENYIFRNDSLAREFREALIERACAGVRVCVMRDWLGCLGQSNARFWQPLLDVGGEVRVYNPPRLMSPFGWLTRDHRKLLAVDGTVGFLGGICVSARWLGDPARSIEPWRDTGVAVRGPAVRDLVAAFADVWKERGAPLAPYILEAGDETPAGDVDLRVVATVPNVATLYRMEHLIAAMARRTLWMTDAYFVGIAPYVQALAAAARDGVDVRLLVPGSSDIPAVGSLSRAGYRPLLEAGVRVFEWQGSMLHAKTAVADGRWARVGSSNLNVASWIGNFELDVTIENETIAGAMQAQYETDLGNATEIVLHARQRVRRQSPPGIRRRRVHGGSSSRAAAGALRLAHTVGAAVSKRRVLGKTESGMLLVGAIILIALAVVAALWPRIVAWPCAVIALWIGLSLLLRYVQARRQRAAS
ncbi:MAG: phospholipase D-like domain-containing protein [Rhodanobacteraceae bacterium]